MSGPTQEAWAFGRPFELTGRARGFRRGLKRLLRAVPVFLPALSSDERSKFMPDAPTRFHIQAMLIGPACRYLGVAFPRTLCKSSRPFALSSSAEFATLSRIGPSRGKLLHPFAKP